jgi:Sec-independent protein translocase protein TatA
MPARRPHHRVLAEDALARHRRAYHPLVSDILLVLIVILVLVVIWRGPKTIPEIGRMFGRGVREARVEASKLRSSDDKPADGDSTTT